MPTITQETFTWPFKGENWKNNFLIGSLMYLAIYVIPVIGWLGVFVAYGYCLLIMRAVLRGEQPTLPKWGRIEELFIDGFKGILAGVGYLIPLILTLSCGLGALFVGYFSFFTTLLNSPRSSSNVFPTPFLMGFAIFFIMMLVGTLFVILFAIPHAIGVAQYARTGQISAGYRFSEILAILRSNVSGFITALLLQWGIGIGLGILMFLSYFTIILCFLNQFVAAPVMFYSMLMWTYLFGLAYREAIAKAGTV